MEINIETEEQGNVVLNLGRQTAEDPVEKTRALNRLALLSGAIAEERNQDKVNTLKDLYQLE